MSNIIDSIQLSGVTYTLSAETSGGGITSGEVQTMIDESISGKVNVSDNEVSGLTVANEITTNVNYNYGDISDFWIEDNSSWQGTSTFSFKSINSSSSTGNCAINYYHSSKIISSVSSSSGNFTYQIADGKLHITFNNGYSLYNASTNSSTYSYYLKSYQGGQSADVIEGSINDALNDTNKRIVENALTGISINLANGSNYLGWTQYYKSANSSINSVTLSDGKTIKYNNGLYVNFSGSTTHTAILNTGSGGYCNSPSTTPNNYADSYSEMSVGFNSDYTGSTTSFTLTVRVYSSSNQYSDEAYTYDSTTNTLTANGQSYKTSFTKDGYNVLFTPIEGYRISRINLNPCKIAGIDVVDKSSYIITSVTAPSYNYNGQEMIDSINTALSGKQDTLSAGTNIDITDNVISVTGISIETSSAVTSGDVRPIQSGALYDELRILGEVESGLTLEWENNDEGYTTNYPSGQCSKITFEVVASGDGWEETANGFYFNNSNDDTIGQIDITIDNGVVTVNDEYTQNVTYSISGNIVTVEYTSIAANVDHIYSVYDNYWTTTAFVNVSGMIPLIDQVSANTISLSDKQDTLSAGTGIQISGNVISATGSTGGGSPTVELTQAEYDALVSAGTVSADTYYIITDAQSPDITQYWTSAQTQSAITQATSGKVNTSSVVSSVTSASTDSEIPTAKAVYDAVGQGGGGGGTTYSAGTNIDITNDTISCIIPAYRSGSSNGISLNVNSNTASGSRSIAGGSNCKATNECAVALGYNSEAREANTFAMGQYAIASGFCSAAICRESQAKNMSEFACGQFNNSVSGSSTFGNSGNTLFSVGNGTSTSARHNAFEIRQNGDMYLNNGTSDIKLQDYLQIKVVKLTQNEYDALVSGGTVDNNTLYVIT